MIRPHFQKRDGVSWWISLKTWDHGLVLKSQGGSLGIIPETSVSVSVIDIPKWGILVQFPPLFLVLCSFDALLLFGFCKSRTSEEPKFTFILRAVCIGSSNSPSYSASGTVWPATCFKCTLDSIHGA